ncbi:hypothetical protein [Streptomyces sp. NPDC050287]|uniref:hypothetical protein n=1 Tax=Streptomyces sp. NPDC050287 TaxID=3365608 RepID=UPI00378A5977
MSRSSSATDAGPDDAAARLALVAACTACDPNGWVLDDDDAAMRRCTHPDVAVPVAGEARR